MTASLNCAKLLDLSSLIQCFKVNSRPLKQLYPPLSAASWTPPQYWKNFVRPSCGDVLTMFGSQYLRLHYSEVDHLCQWVLDSKEACQKGGTLEDLIKRDVTSKNANKEHGSKDIPAVIDITDQDQAKVSILSSASPKKNTRNGRRGRGEEHNWVTISSLRLTETDKHVLLEGEWLNDKHIHASQLLMKNDSSLYQWVRSKAHCWVKPYTLM